MSNDNLTGGELTDLPNDKYRQFFEKFKEIETLDISEWKVAHILGYFCKKYQEAYNIPYKFKFNSPSPSKCFEVFQVKKLASLLTAQPNLLKDYIDWVYENKVVKAKRKLTSISFMVQEDTINFYKVNILFAGKKNLGVNRSTYLPDDIKQIFGGCGITINTYGDLAFLSQMADMPDNLKVSFENLKTSGFEMELLQRIV
jgi:hypothetical protein